MGHDDLIIFRRTLESILDELRMKSSAAVAGISGGYEYCADEADRATLEADRDMLLLMEARARAASHSVQEALRRLDRGEYGICEECGEDIGLARLRAQPMATLCVACKSRREATERHLALAG